MKAYTSRLLASLAALQLAVTSALSTNGLLPRDSDSSAVASSSSSNETLASQNVTSLLYPDCRANATADWCGIVIGIDAWDNDTTVYNVSITDSSCTRVGRTDGIKQNSTTNLSTSVGDWTFKIYHGSGLDMLYNGLDIGNASIFGDDMGVEKFNFSGDGLSSVIFGDYRNCTPASEAKSDSTRVQQLPGVLMGFALAAVAIVFMGLL